MPKSTNIWFNNVIITNPPLTSKYMGMSYGYIYSLYTKYTDKFYILELLDCTDIKQAYNNHKIISDMLVTYLNFTVKEELKEHRRGVGKFSEWISMVGDFSKSYYSQTLQGHSYASDKTVKLSKLIRLLHLRDLYRLYKSNVYCIDYRNRALAKDTIVSAELVDKYKSLLCDKREAILQKVGGYKDKHENLIELLSVIYVPARAKKLISKELIERVKLFKELVNEA